MRIDREVRLDRQRDGETVDEELVRTDSRETDTWTEARVMDIRTRSIELSNGRDEWYGSIMNR